MDPTKRVWHRPWPLPSRPWVMKQTWHDLLFAHWPMPPSILRAAIPERLELDVRDGEAWLGVVPFRMSGVRARWLPPLPGASAFPELNLRTYVRVGGKPGVWFFCLEATNALAVAAARLGFSLPYFRARMTCERDGDDIRYASTRIDRRGAPAEFVARYGPRGAVFESRPGTLEHWLTERYCLYAARPQTQSPRADRAPSHGDELRVPSDDVLPGSDRAPARDDGALLRGDIHHHPWPLQPAEAHIDRNSIASAHGFELPARAPLLHFARRLDVVVWWPERADQDGALTALS